MLFLYDLGIRFYEFLIRVAAFKNKKAALWIQGRKNILQRIQSQTEYVSRPFWFHFASLGEFEQGRTVLEKLKSLHPDLPIVITFFSPSGYEIRKDYPLASNVFYLPSDTKSNAKEFIRIVKPAAAIFTKYEYWYHYFDELSKNEIPLLIISGIFRKNQTFFKWYGSLHREMLRNVTHFFVQNEESQDLLKGLGFSNVTISGDTRFDRVIENSLRTPTNDLISKFCAGNPVLIAGSTWLEDETLLSKLIKSYPEWKFIIAPHEIHENRIKQIEDLFTKSIRYSSFSIKGHTDKQVLIIDNIGMLSTLYQYGRVAYIGGGFGAGIHNIQEAAAFSLPLLFGPNYEKFQEAKDLIKLKAAYSVKNQDELNSFFGLIQDESAAQKYGELAKQYVQGKGGATESIINYIKSKGIITKT